MSIVHSYYDWIGESVKCLLQKAIAAVGIALASPNQLFPSLTYI
ncbi:hypothetical protein [Chroococcidiopsis sp.]